MNMKHFDEKTGKPVYHIRGCRCYFQSDCCWPYCHCQVVYDEKTSRPLRLGEKTFREYIYTGIAIIVIFLTVVLLLGAPFPWQW